MEILRLKTKRSGGEDLEGRPTQSSRKADAEKDLDGGQTYKVSG
jgi:hypothetical protein